MDALTDKEIMKASDAIDKAFAAMTKENRGETAQRILNAVRNLNDHIADKLWSSLNPSQPMDVNKVASKMNGKYRFISNFDKFLRASVSHFTPSEDGSERLLLKYYKYLLQLKKAVFDAYGMVILKNVGCFIDDTDEQTREYYAKVAKSIDAISVGTPRTESDNYYIDKIKPFYVNNDIYYEVTLEPVTNKANKFQRITAFTHHDIFSNYSVSLSFVDTRIAVFGTSYPIKVIVDWSVSIRPCEINNFSDLINMSIETRRGNNDYRFLMEYITRTHWSLVDIIDLPQDEYRTFESEMLSANQGSRSSIITVLNKCRDISRRNMPGVNIIRYLLLRMNNTMLKDQRPTTFQPKTYAEYNLSSKCMPFDKQPYAFYPRKHITNLYDLYQCIDASKHKAELLKRYIDNNTYSNHVLFTPIEELASFGTQEEVLALVQEFNNSLYSGFRPASEIGVYKNHLFINEHEEGIFKIIEALKELASEPFSAISSAFSELAVGELETLPEDVRLDDPIKKKILVNMFLLSRVHCIYGAAGTGKTTLVNHISHLLLDKKRIFLAKTHPAVENLRRKVVFKNTEDEFVTIDQFTKNARYEFSEYDLIVVDECSTVQNQELIKILERLGNAALVLMGDTYQIEAIGFGNWFSIVKNVMPAECCHELTTPYRSTDTYLRKLWDEVRNMQDVNVALERMVRSDYSHPIDDDIFQRKADDEIILCLNYNGLYGLNNINKLLQLSNPSPAVTIGVWQFKKGDPVLFNDSERFSCLYNNLKGKIVDIEDRGDTVYFVVEVNATLTEDDVKFEDGLSLLQADNKKSHVAFVVNRRKPYSSDNEETTNHHIVPFQIAYAVSIHKSQGLEFDSVKIVIADESEDRITHNIFYTAITRARNFLTIYWSPEVCDRILARIRPANSNKDFLLLKAKRQL